MAERHSLAFRILSASLPRWSLGWNSLSICARASTGRVELIWARREFHPEWRGYNYIQVANEILIIDPGSREIVEISGSSGRLQQAKNADPERRNDQGSKDCRKDDPVRKLPIKCGLDAQSGERHQHNCSRHPQKAFSRWGHCYAN